MGVRKKTNSQNIRSNHSLRRHQSGANTDNIQASSRLSHREEDDREEDDRDALSAEGAVPDRKAQVWQVVAMIPKGKVATYGQIAALIGLPSHARFIGATLRNLPKNTKLPWFRVVNSSLRISLRGGGEQRQRRLLEAEDVIFIGERVAKHHRWEAGLE